MTSNAEAQKVIQVINATSLEVSALTVNEAKPQEKRSSNDGCW